MRVNKAARDRDVTIKPISLFLIVLVFPRMFFRGARKHMTMALSLSASFGDVEALNVE